MHPSDSENNWNKGFRPEVLDKNLHPFSTNKNPVPKPNMHPVNRPTPGVRPIAFPGNKFGNMDHNEKISATNSGNQATFTNDELYDDDSLNGDTELARLPVRPEGDKSSASFSSGKTEKGGLFLHGFNDANNGNLQKILGQSPYLLINLPLLNRTTQTLQNGTNLTTKNRIAANFLSNDVLVTLLINYKFLFRPITFRNANSSQMRD